MTHIEARTAPYIAHSRLIGIGILLVSLFASSLLACGASDVAEVSIGPEAALERLRSEDPPLFLDVRTPAEYERAHIPGALNIPHTEVAARIDEIRAEGADEIIVFCERGGRAREARLAMDAAGIGGVAHMAGDMRTWRARRLPTVPGAQRGSIED